MRFYLGMRGPWIENPEDGDPGGVITAYPRLPYKMVPADNVWDILERLGTGVFLFSKSEGRLVTGPGSVSPPTVMYDEMIGDEYLIIMNMELRPGSTNVEANIPPGELPRPRRMIIMNDAETEDIGA